MALVFILLVIIGSTQKLAPFANAFLDSYGKYLRMILLIVAFSFP